MCIELIMIIYTQVLLSTGTFWFTVAIGPTIVIGVDSCAYDTFVFILDNYIDKTFRNLYLENI